MKEQFRELTRAELQIMQILWQMDKGFVNDIIAELPEPKPAYNTVSTIVRILEKKGFVGHRSYGKTHEYFPLMTKIEYTDYFMNSVLNNFFDNSVSNMVSFFSRHERISLGEMDEIIRMLDETAKEKV